MRMSLLGKLSFVQQRFKKPLKRRQSKHGLQMSYSRNCTLGINSPRRLFPKDMKIGKSLGPQNNLCTTNERT